MTIAAAAGQAPGSSPRGPKRRGSGARLLPLVLGCLAVLISSRAAHSDVVVLPALKDNTVYEGNPTGSNGAGDYIFTGTTSNGDSNRTLIGFDVPGNVPPGSTIDGVTLRLHLSRANTDGGEITTLHLLLADWGEGWSDAVGEEGGGAPPTPGDATWISRFHPDEAWSSPGGDFDPAVSGSANVGGPGTYTWSTAGMTADIQDWLDDPASSFGWTLRGNEDASGTAKRFDSRSNPTVSDRPQLTIDFTPSGVTSGSCCLPGERCILLAPSDCTSQGGSYQGDGTTCTTAPCEGVPITIVIEPSRDNTLYEEGDLSNGGGEYLFSGMNAALIKRRGLLGFDLTAAIPSGALVSAATLTMYKTFGGSAAADVTLHRSLSDWGEGTADAEGDEELGAPAETGDATWTHAFHPDQSWSSPGGDYVTTPSATTYVAFEDFYSWTGPGMVADLQAWVDDPSGNFGWFVVGRETFTAITRKRWVSRESADLDLRPRLEITYSVPPPPPDLGLPPVPVPPENPITEGKRVLGKILFWEEQLSSDGTVACGTCHRPGDGGIDPRVGLHPGADLEFGTEDDIFGSPGIRRADSEGNYYPDPVFGEEVQVTGRASQNFFGGLWAQRNFWDGRADGTFRDPVTDEVVILVGGALESQAVGPIVSDVEMAFESRGWSDVASGLVSAIPMVLAADLPLDVLEAIAASPTYPDLFAAAFGDPAITPARIAFALATYERTLVADQTPWDLFMAGDTGGLTPAQQAGADFVQNGPCAACHGGPLFTSDTFRNIGLRPPEEDNGREGITGLPADRGRFKVPSLRNVGLRNRLMHTGHIEDVADALRFYAMIGHTHFTENQDENILGGIAMTPEERAEIEDFLVHGLTDPRVAEETFPFDRPRLSSETPSGLPEGGTVDGGDASPRSFQAEAFPNPFREQVAIRFRLPNPDSVEISVFTAGGQLLVRQNVDGTAGENVWHWSGRTVHGSQAPHGVYFVRLRTSQASGTGRIVRVE